MHKLTALVASITFALLSGVHAHAGSIIADYTSLPDTGAAGVPLLSLAGTTVTGSANVAIGVPNESRGVGVVSGTSTPASNFSLEGFETLTIDYGQLVTNVTVDFWDVSPPGNVTYGFEAFNGANSLGTFAIPLHVSNLQTSNLTALSGGLNFTKVTFSVSSAPSIGITMHNTTFDHVVPEPGSMVLFGLGALGVAAGGLRRRRNQVESE